MLGKYKKKNEIRSMTVMVRLEHKRIFTKNQMLLSFLGGYWAPPIGKVTFQETKVVQLDKHFGSTRTPRRPTSCSRGGGIRENSFQILNSSSLLTLFEIMVVPPLSHRTMLFSYTNRRYGLGSSAQVHAQA